MKKLIAIILFSAIGIYSVKAQVETSPPAGISSVKAQDEGDKGGFSFGKEDKLMLNFYTDLWQNVDSAMTVSAYSPGFDVYGMYNIPFGKSKFGLRLGLGFGTHNIRSDAMPADEMKYDSVLGNIETTIFERIPDYVINKEIKYDINKLTLTYFDIPLELRYKTENQKGKAIKFAIGFKAGYLLSSHTKYKGTKYKGNINDPDMGKDIKVKTYKIKNLEPLRYGATVRFGYGIYNIFGYYSLSKIFKADKGPEMFPISVGICITPF